MKKVYALVDCDSFFVSCEQAVNPDLKGKPVCVTGGANGCVVSRSREAKKIGLPMGYPVFMAKKEFKDIIYIRNSVWKTNDVNLLPYEHDELPSYNDVLKDKRNYLKSSWDKRFKQIVRISINYNGVNYVTTKNN